MKLVKKLKTLQNAPYCNPLSFRYSSKSGEYNIRTQNNIVDSCVYIFKNYLFLHCEIRSFNYAITDLLDLDKKPGLSIPSHYISQSLSLSTELFPEFSADWREILPY